jgi:hypothetical protein
MAEMNSVDDQNPNDTRGELLWEEPEFWLKRKKRLGYIAGYITMGMFVVSVIVALMYYPPQAIIVYSMIGLIGGVVLLFSKLLLPIRIYENGVEYGMGPPPILTPNIIFLSWSECKTFRETDIGYYFADARNRRRTFIKKDLPGAQEAVERIKDRICVADE